MMDTDARIEEELFPFYALGALTAEEQAEVEAYLLANPDAAARLHDLSLGADALMLTVEPVAPSAATRDQFMSRVRESQSTASAPAPAPKKPTSTVAAATPTRPSWLSRLMGQPATASAGRSPWPALALVGGLVLVLGLGWAALSLNNQLTATEQQVAGLQDDLAALAGENETLSAQLAEQEAALAATADQVDALTQENMGLRQELATQADQLALYQEPGAVTMSIGSISDAVPDATATLVRLPGTGQTVMHANNLPELQAAQDYQLWLIADGVPVSAGVFDAAADGRATLELAGGLPADLQAVGISIEPAGGSEAPTPDQIILLGEVTS